MHVWTSLEQVVADFGIAPNLSDYESVRSELRKITAALHPDKNGGSFASESDKARFLRAQSAIEFLDAVGNPASAMIPVAQLPAIVSAVAQALTVRPQSDVQSLHSAFLSEARSRISRHFLLPKIGSGVFAAITGFLVAFPDKFEKHPYLGPLLQERTTQLFILTLLMYSVVGFAFTWYRERVAESRAEYLMSESAMGRLFEILTQSYHHIVSSRQILEAVAQVAGSSLQMPPSPFLLLSRPRLDLQTLEKAASIQTQRLVERRVLAKVEVLSLDAWYKFNVRNDASLRLSPAGELQR